MTQGRDYPDWGGYNSGASMYPLKDLAELAARLDSPLMFFRSGMVSFMESFQYGLGRWNRYQGGTGVLPTLSATHCYSKGFSVKLNGGTVAADYSRMSTLGLIPPTLRWGLSCRFAFESLAVKLRIGYARISPDSIIYAQVEYNMVTGVWSASTTGGALVSIASMAIAAPEPSLFYALKFVCNMETNEMETVYLNEEVYGGLHIPLHEEVGGIQDQIDTRLAVYNNGGVDAIVYIDDVILTYNEP